MTTLALTDLPTIFRERAAVLREYGSAEGAATAWETAATEVESAPSNQDLTPGRRGVLGHLKKDPEPVLDTPSILRSSSHEVDLSPVLGSLRPDTACRSGSAPALAAGGGSQ